MGGASSLEFGPASVDYKVTIQYCGGWGYQSKAVDAQKYLTRNFGDKLHIVLLYF